MNSQAKRRDTEKLQNKRRRQKWHFLRDCCVAFVGRKMKCEDQREMEGGRGHGENGMSKNKKQKRKCVRDKTNLWEMSQESVRLAPGRMMDWVGMEAGGGTGFCRLVDREEQVIWILCYFKKVNSSEMGDEYKTKKKKHITSLWSRISLAGR